MKFSVGPLCVCLLLIPAAFASTVIYTASLSGPNESPVNASPGTGFSSVTVDNVANTLNVVVSFSGLTSPTTASHIHCCTIIPGAGTAGVATVTPSFTDFPLGVTSGTYSHVFDLTMMSSWNPAFVTANGGTTAGAEAALLAGLAADESYLNIHTTNFPSGEIRGFLVTVPEPSTFALLGLALTSFLLVKVRRPTRL